MVRLRTTALSAALLLAFGACSPTVEIKAPEKPIVIDLNIKIEQEVRIKVEKDVDKLLKQNDELF